MILGSRELIRDINSRLVLETILKEGSISRADISKKLGLTKATISSIIQELLNENLILETGSDDTKLGRKPILITFNRHAGSAVSIDIGSASTSILMTDLGGEIKALRKIRTPKPHELINVLSGIISDMLTMYKNTPLNKLVGIAASIHGITFNNNIIFTPYYNLSSCDIAGELSDIFCVPVHLENEANLSVISERAFISSEYSNIAAVSIHSGVGVGIIEGGRLCRGSKGFAGEFGHTVIDIDGRPCPCGNNGCLEQYLSERALLSDFMKEYGNSAASEHSEDELCTGSDTSHDFTVFENSLRLNAQAALKTADNFVKYMAVCINNIMNTVNPEVIIINSSFTRAFPELTDRIAASLNSRFNTSVIVKPSALGDRSALLGGICVCIADFLGLEDFNSGYIISNFSI